MGISTHILDTSKGRPGAGVKTILELLTPSKWQEIGSGVTNEDGRLPGLVPVDHQLKDGIYRLTFDVNSYFESQSIKCFYPYVQITFEILDPSQHFHVPLLLSPFGYSTYRGS
jgi:5-hydroxyisourate hydrolase